MCQIVCVSVCAGKIAPSHFVIALLLAGRFRNPVTIVHHESISTSLRASRSRKEILENSDNIQTIFRQYSDLSREFSDNTQAIFRQYSGNIQTAIVGQLCKIQPSFSGSEKPGFRWSFPMFPMLGVWVSLQIRIMLLFPLAPTPAPLPAKGLISAKTFLPHTSPRITSRRGSTNSQ